jgi:hypothetical protein
MKLFLDIKIKLVKLFAIVVLLPSFGWYCGELYAQDSELFGTWYLTKVTVDNIDYIPSEYGYYPDLVLTDDNGDYGISLADPDNISCQTSIENFQGNPDSFIVNQDLWVCFPEQNCSEDPLCIVIYGRHSEIYYGITTPFNYNIEQNSDGSFSLEIVNTEGGQAYYSSEFLSNQDFILNGFKLYPNPVKETLQIRNASIQIVYASIYDINGKLLQKHTLETNTSTIDVKALNQGLYFVVFESETGERVSRKFIKQ